MASSGNFCTLNPLAQPNSGTYSEGNLLFTHTTNNWRTSSGTLAVSSGKWYWEAYQYESLSGNGFPVGIYDISGGKLVSNQASTYPGRTTSTYGLGYSVYSNSGSYASKYTNQSETNTSLSIGVSGDVWQCALDLDNNKLWFGKNNSWDNSANPALGSNETYAIDSGKEYVPVTCSYNDSGSENFPQNFGQDSTFSGRISAGGNADGNGFGDFKYAPPTGFLALCSGNLPVSDDIDPAQTDDNHPDKLFHAGNYQGTNADKSVTIGFKPDIVLFKSADQSGSSTSRGSDSYTSNWWFYDSSRGALKNMMLNHYNAEATVANTLKSFDTNGFTVGATGETYYGTENALNNLITHYAWKLNGGTTASNSEGNISSTTQASDATGMSMVLYNGNGSQGQTIGHGLSATPELVVFKNRDQGSTPLNMDWVVALSQATGSPFRSINGDDHCLDFNDTNGGANFYTSSDGTGLGFTPTSTTFHVPNNGNAPYWFNRSGDDYIGWCMHSVEGFSKYTQYTGNGNADGPFIYTGMQVTMVWIKSIGATGDWSCFSVHDTSVNSGYISLKQNPVATRLEINTGNNRATDCSVDFLSNGFKIRTSDSHINNSGTKYIVMAWSGSAPFKYNNTI